MKQKLRRKKKRSENKRFVDPSVRSRVYSKDPKKKAEEQRMFRRNNKK